jgi:hypothetical protein
MARFKIFFLNIIDYKNTDLGIIASKIIELSNTDTWWIDDESRLKYSITKCDLSGDYIIGTITQQHYMEQHLYDDKKRESSNIIDTFEDRLFILYIEQKIIVLQWDRFINKQPLNRGLMVSHLEKIMSNIFSDNINLIPFPVIKTDKKEFLNIFYSNKVAQIVIDNFGQDIIDDDIILVNPMKQLEGALREIIAHDARHSSLTTIIAKSGQGDNGDLRGSAIVRGAMHSGKPRRIRYYNRQGQVKIRNKTENSELEVTIPVSYKDTPAERVAMANAAVEQLQTRDFDIDIKAFPKKQMQQTSLEDLIKDSHE